MWRRMTILAISTITANIVAIIITYVRHHNFDSSAHGEMAIVQKGKAKNIAEIAGKAKTKLPHCSEKKNPLFPIFR